MPSPADPAEAAIAVVPPGAAFTVRPVTSDDSAWIRKVLRQYWASESVLSRGRVINAIELPGFAALRDDEPIGLITYQIIAKDCEIVTHNSMADSGGIGSCLLAAVRNHARSEGCERLWLVTTNDNTPALRFYQRRDFDILALHRHAVTEGRKLKPEIPDQGLGGIQIRHELELEYRL